MSDEKRTTIIAVAALVVAIACCAGCALALTMNDTTGLYIGEHEVTGDGALFGYEYGNMDYDRDTNTLYVFSGVISLGDEGYRVYDGIMVGSNERDRVGFIVSYEGTKALNIVFIGDCIIMGAPGETEYVGGFYFAEETIVNISGPGLLQSRYVNHSLFYGREAELMIDDLDMKTEQTIDVPLAANSISINDSNLDFSTRQGYAGIYTSQRTVIRNSDIDTVGFDEGVHLGSTYIYDSWVTVDAEDIGFKVYACNSYDSYLSSTSANHGMYFYNPLHFYGGWLHSEAQSLYAVYSGDTTLEFHDATVEAYTVNGSAIQAWHVNIYGSYVNAESANGYGIYANFNATVSDLGIPRVLVDESTVQASGGTAAIWAIGEIELDGSTLGSGNRILSADGPRGALFSSVCAKSETELEVLIEGNHAEPVNASKDVWIEVSY